MSKKQLEWFDLQTECYQYLQRVLVDSGLENEALVTAEVSRSRAFFDLQLERHSRHVANKSKLLDTLAAITERDIVNIVNRQKAAVIYYSIAVDRLLLWLILPTRGVVKFHQVDLRQDAGTQHGVPDKNSLAELIDSTRESLGVEPAVAIDGPEDDGASTSGTIESALSDKLNHDQSGFLRMVNRSSRLNASSYSLSSLFSVGSLNNERSGPGSTYAGSRHGSTRSGRRGNPSHALWQGPSALKQLYRLLLEPLEDDLPEGGELMLVLEDDLYLVPFAVLKGGASPDFLCERFNLILSPSLSSAKIGRESANRNKDSEEKTDALVVGNPKVPSSVAEQWGWTDLPQAGREAETVAEIFQTTAVTGEKATKSEVVSRMADATCIHFACHVSWKLSAIVLSPGEFVESKSAEASPPSLAPPSKARYALHNETIHEEDGIEDAKSEDDRSTLDAPALSEFLLTAGDILKLKLTAKLVVLSNCYNREERVTPRGVIALTGALLAAGAQCVLVSLWPTTDQAVHVTMKTLYSSLLQGARVSRALSEAMATVHNTKHFQHPANWAGFSLVGADVKVSNKVALMGQALRDILTSPEKCRDALRVTLHLVSPP
jgi:CHAT domain-containing protein